MEICAWAATEGANHSDGTCKSFMYPSSSDSSDSGNVAQHLDNDDDERLRSTLLQQFLTFPTPRLRQVEGGLRKP